MNAIRISLITAAALSALAGAPVRADDITPDPYQHMVSTRTRAEVVAELQAAIRSGEIAASREDSGSMHFARLAPKSTLTRAQVRAAVLAARRDGMHDALTGEDSGSFYFASRRRSDGEADAVRFARVVR